MTNIMVVYFTSVYILNAGELHVILFFIYFRELMHLFYHLQNVTILSTVTEFHIIYFLLLKTNFQGFLTPTLSKVILQYYILPITFFVILTLPNNSQINMSH